MGGCGCLLVLCVCLLAVVAFSFSQGWLPLSAGETPPASPTAPSRATRTPLPRSTSQATPIVPGTPIAPGTPAAPAASTAFPGISRVVLATATQGDNKDPLGVTDTFAPVQQIFHAVVSVAALPDNTKVKAVWYVVNVGTASDVNSLIDQFELTASGTQNLDFTLTVGPTGKWPVGSYKVEIYVNGILARTVPFQVK